MLNRRNLFAAAPAAALVGLAVPAAAQSELATLGAQWEIVVAERDRLGEQIDKAFERFHAGMPKTPRLRFTEVDQRRSNFPADGGSHWEWKEVERISREAKTWKLSDQYPRRTAWARRFERAVDRHAAAVAAWDAECGMSASERAWDAKDDELTAIERAIIAAPCRSVGDAQAKARVALRNQDNDFGRDAGTSVAEFVLRMGAN